MKRTIIIIPFILFTLASCNPKENNGKTNASNDSTEKTTVVSKGKVELSLGNYANYIAINTTFSSPFTNYSDVVYYSYFIGSDHCKFIDCTISYKYVLNGGSAQSSVETVPLTLSGDGQANPFYARLNNRGNYYSIVVTNASGTVQIL